jgi:hypothetical protein
VRTAGQQLQRCFGLRLLLGLGQDPPAHRNDRIGAERDRPLLGKRRRLCGGQAHRMVGRQLARARRLVDVGGNDHIGNDANARQQLEPAWTCGGEDEPHRGRLPII